jgi:hypothetical protein
MARSSLTLRVSMSPPRFAWGHPSGNRSSSRHPFCPSSVESRLKVVIKIIAILKIGPDSADIIYINCPLNIRQGRQCGLFESSSSSAWSA